MKPGAPALQSIRLLDQLRECIRYMHYSLSTEKVYWHWVRFFIRWHGRGGRSGTDGGHHRFDGGLLQSGAGIRTVQERLGHSGVFTTLMYTHVLKAAAGGTASPLKALNTN